MFCDICFFSILFLYLKKAKPSGMKSFWIYPLFFLLYSLNLKSQSSEVLSNKENFEEGEYFFNRGDYEEAVFYYMKLLSDQPNNSNFNFKIGESYLNIPGKEPLAVPYFEKAVINTTEKNKYKKNSFEENKAPLHAYFYLGNAYRFSNQLDKALDAYKTFVNSPFYAGNYNVTIVENEIKSCERAKIIEDNPILFDEILLENNINTSAYESMPVFSGNGKKLVFVRRLKFYDGVFCSSWNGTGWEEPVNLNSQVGSDGDLYPSSISFNGDVIYFIKSVNENKDIYVSKLQDGFWSKAEKLDKKINTLANESHASVSDDGELLFISSDRLGGHGGYDIYVSQKEGNGWSRPKNLGKTINTSFDEVTPFSVNNGKMLFFSSKGHYNMGGLDIFYSLLEGKKWSDPINIGSPVNNTSDNSFFQPASGGAGFISKTTPESEGSDIFKIIFRSYIPKY